MKQFVLPEDLSNPEGALRLDGKDFHYLIHVRRYGVGDSLRAISRDGKRYDMEFLTVLADSCEVCLKAVGESLNDTDIDVPSVRIVLIPAVTKGKKMDLTIRQAVEAGAAAVLPVISDHCQVRYRNVDDAESKKQRWERIAIEALQQCGGGRATEIGTPEDIRTVIDAWAERGPLLFLHEKTISAGNDASETESLFKSLAVADGELAIIVGPEGGLSPAETQYLLKRNAVPVYLGNRVLRAETAALYGLAAVSTIIREKSEWHPV